MKKFWNSLGLWGKIALIAGTVILLVLLYDLFTGGLSDIRGKIFDRHYAERMQQVDKLEKENDELRRQKAELEKKAIELAAKDAIYESKDKELDSKVKQEVNRLDDALAQLEKEEAVTEQPTDAYTRCVRVKQKMLAMTPPVTSASSINCEDYRGN